MLKKCFTSVTLMLTLAWATPASALNITFDPTGTAGPGGNLTIDVLDPTVGNTLVQGLTTSSAILSPATTLFQANLGVASLLGVTQFANGTGGNFFTIVAGFSETLLANSGGAFPTLVLGLNTAAPSFFNVYATAATGDNLAGTGFVGASPPILSGVFINTGAPGDGLSTFTVTGAGAPLDAFGVNNYPGVSTLSGLGAFSTTVLVTARNVNYFPDVVVGTTLAFVTSELHLNYAQVDPSACFSTNGTVGCNTPGVTSVGANNTVSGPNTMLQTDANVSFGALSPIPEPATLTLLGIGGLIAGLRRRRNVAQN